MNPRADSETEVASPQRNRCSRMWVHCVFAALVFVGTVSGVVSAHVPSTGARIGFRFPILVGGSALIGSLGGVAVVAYRSRNVVDWLTDRRLGGAVGAGLSGLAGLILLSIVTTHPLLSGASVLGGVLGAAILSTHDEDGFGRLEVASATGALTLHQFVEGAILAGAYVAGGVVGVVAALFLTLHTVAETATVAGTYATVGQYRRGAAAVIFMQAVYVVAAGLAFIAAWSIPALAGDLLAAVVASVLLVVGLHELWCAVRESLVAFSPFDDSEGNSTIENRGGR